jgi:hypothetical protein
VIADAFSFSDRTVPEVIQPFRPALQPGEFITDAAAVVGTYRKKGARWLAASGGVRPRRGREERRDETDRVQREHGPQPAAIHQITQGSSVLKRLDAIDHPTAHPPRQRRSHDEHRPPTSEHTPRTSTNRRSTGSL